MGLFIRWTGDTRGATAIEYGLLMAAVALGILLAIYALGDSLYAIFYEHLPDALER